MSEVVSKGTQGSKDLSDSKAFDYFRGFLMVIKFDYDEEALYNHIDHFGSIIWGPVEKAMQVYAEEGGQMNDKVWQAFHEV